MVLFNTIILAALSAVSSALPAVVEERQCRGPAVNQATLTLVQNSEGWRASAYRDPTGHWTIGYGHLCSAASCTDVPYSQPISTAQGQTLLRNDLYTAQQCVTLQTTSNVRLNANEYGALVDFTFNLGCANFRSSTLLRRLNNGENPQTVLPEELPKWVYSNGQKLPGLVTRRNNEIDLARTPTSTPALPAC